MNNTMESVEWLPGPVILTTSNRDRDMLRLAYKHANEVSPDPSTKNGAVLVDTLSGSLIFGVNKFPPGIAETESRLINKSTKYRLIVHAENSAIFNAAKHGRIVYGATLYCPFYACSECAKAIIQSGIRRVVGHAQLMALASEHTTWVQSIIYAWDMLHEAEVRCDLYDGSIGLTTRFNGKDIPV